MIVFWRVWIVRGFVVGFFGVTVLYSAYVEAATAPEQQFWVLAVSGWFVVGVACLNVITGVVQPCITKQRAARASALERSVGREMRSPLDGPSDRDAEITRALLAPKANNAGLFL